MLRKGGEENSEVCKSQGMLQLDSCEADIFLVFKGLVLIHYGDTVTTI